MNELDVALIEKEKLAETNIVQSIYDLDQQINLMSEHADRFDYYVAAASGIVCGMLDILWVGEFDLQRGREFANGEVEEFVGKIAEMFGCKDSDLRNCVKFLEEKFPMATDGNTVDFGGGLQHHLKDFAHHPTIIGLIFSMLTQFTGMSYGTKPDGTFLAVPVPENHKQYLGKNIPDKVFKGTIIWFFHLVSDMAGSSSTAELSGGTGIPGPILSLAKEISALPCFQNTKVNNTELSLNLSKIFNGTVFAKHDENGKKINGTEVRLDLRGELGTAVEIGRQAVPVIANECIVRAFYFVRRLAAEMQKMNIHTFSDLGGLDWEVVKPYGSPTVDRMLTVATGVFTAVDLTDAVLTEQYFLSVNYMGVGRFTIAIEKEMIHFLKIRDVKKVKEMYEKIRRNTYSDVIRSITEWRFQWN